MGYFPLPELKGKSNRIFVDGKTLNQIAKESGIRLDTVQHRYSRELIKKTPKGKVDVKYTLEIVNRFDTSGRDVNSPYCGNHYVEIENM